MFSVPYSLNAEKAAGRHSRGDGLERIPDEGAGAALPGNAGVRADPRLTVTSGDAREGPHGDPAPVRKILRTLNAVAAASRSPGMSAEQLPDPAVPASVPRIRHPIRILLSRYPMARGMPSRAQPAARLPGGLVHPQGAAATATPAFSTSCGDGPGRPTPDPDWMRHDAPHRRPW